MKRFAFAGITVLLAFAGLSARAQSPTPRPAPPHATVSPSPSPSATPGFPRVRDAALRKAAQHINEQLTAVNKKWTGVLDRFLTQLQKILDRISASAEKRKARGADVAVANETIAKARTALDAARVAVREQAGKTYDLDDATDISVRDQLRAARAQLHDDLAAVVAKVRAAHRAVSDAARALARSHPGKPSPSPTHTP